MRKYAKAEALGLLGTGSESAAASDPIGDALRADAVAYWTMNEASGTRADATGSGLDLSDHLSNISSAAGKVGNAATFSDNGVLKHITAAPFNMAGKSFSFAGWVKINSLVDDGVILSKGDIDDAIEYQLEWNTSSSRFVFKNMGDTYGNFEVAANTFGVPTAGEYVFLYLFTDLVSNGIGISVNNGSSDTAEFIVDNLNGNTPFSIGGEYSSLLTGYYYNLNAAVDELLFIERLLTSDERAYLYNSGAGRGLY